MSQRDSSTSIKPEPASVETWPQSPTSAAGTLESDSTLASRFTNTVIEGASSNEVEQSAGSTNSFGIASSSPVGVQRKRSRCDSDPLETSDPLRLARPPEKMYKSYDDIDTDTEMENLILDESAESSPSGSPTQRHILGSAVGMSGNRGSGVEGKGKAPEVPPRPIVTGEHEQTSGRQLLGPCKRDDQFYLEDGSCIFLVQDTLFNVHRSILSKDSSSFSTMFSLPQGGKEIEGRSDENPIILIGDSPEEFRHFLSALYALPPELKQLTSQAANLGHLIDITRVANKYSFKSIETWALDAIQDYVNRKPSPIKEAIPPPHSYIFTSGVETENQLTRLIRLAQLCQHDRLLNTMIGLLRSLMSSSVQYAYLAMTLVDELDLRALRGAAYLEVMQKGFVVKNVKLDILKLGTPSAALQASVSSSALGIASASATASHAFQSSTESVPSDLSRIIITPEQQLRLLAGYYRLTSVWEKMRLTNLHFEHSHACGATWHQQGCNQSWLEFWKERTRSDAVMSLGMADVIGRLKMVHKEYDRWGSATYMHHDCRINAKKAMTDAIRKVEDALPDFFAEPGALGED